MNLREITKDDINHPIPKTPPPANIPKVVGKIIIKFMDDDTFEIRWPEAEIGYLKAIGALHVAINDLYVKAAGIQVKLPNGDFGNIEDV